jgi:hypothetical protein
MQLQEETNKNSISVVDCMGINALAMFVLITIS